jgi:hypothetical protein
MDDERPTTAEMCRRPIVRFPLVEEITVSMIPMNPAETC